MSTGPISRNSSTPAPGAEPVQSEGAHPEAHAEFSQQQVEVGFALLKGQTDGVDVDIMSASATLTADEVTFQAGLAHMDFGKGSTLSASVDNFTAKASVSTHNPDGSVGVNIGAGATIVGAEASGTILGATTATVGLSAGVGAELGVGIRDFDKDNNPELCARVSMLFFTAGLCIENPF